MPGACSGRRVGPIISDTYSSVCKILTDEIFSYDRIARSDKFNPLILGYTPDWEARPKYHSRSSHNAELDKDMGRILDKYSMLISSSDGNAADQNYDSQALRICQCHSQSH